MNQSMKKQITTKIVRLKRVLILCVLSVFYLQTFAQINVDVNLNIKHSVDGISDFGRDRHMTIHSSFTEGDWNGYEDKLDYLLNDLDVYFGRDNGSTGWKNALVTEDPKKPHWPDANAMIGLGDGMKKWYETTYPSRTQYDKRKKKMIMGMNDSPVYPTLSWDANYGKAKGGWFPVDVDASAFWIANYLDKYFAKSDGDIGEKLPYYWECINEPDMSMMNPQVAMIITSPEKSWQFHKLTAQAVREKLGAKAPKIGGMTWGLLDLFKPDGVSTRATLDYWTKWLTADNPMIPVYNNMLKGLDGNPSAAWANRTKDWWQWDYLYQGFIDYTGADMDFYGVHMYDWPDATNPTYRSGGHTEAMLDMFEWYDNLKFGKKKDIVMSEFGAVSGYAATLPAKRRDWEFLKPFNQMFMQFLQRPSHVVLTMPFAPVRAEWGAYPEGNKYVAGTPMVRYEGATLMDPVGTWTYPNQPSGGWEWSDIIYFFQLWRDVDGTRIDTKSNNNDVQVDAYVKDNKVFLILNNCESDNKSVNLNFFNQGTANTLSSVTMRHLFFDATKGTQGEPALTEISMQSAPTQVVLKPNSTIVLVYTYNNLVAINQEKKETKYMCQPLTTAKNDLGSQLCRTPAATTAITATIPGVVKPAKGEAIVRISGQFFNPIATPGYITMNSVKVNGNELMTTGNTNVNPRGVLQSGWKGGWFGTLEISCPISYLVNGTNTVICQRSNQTAYTTIMLQVFDCAQDIGRSGTATVALTNLAIGGAESVMNGTTLAIVPAYTPTNATNKALTWTSSNTSVATVNENGIVTAKASTGTATITATSVSNATLVATKVITAIPFQATLASSIQITNGQTITVDKNVNTQLNVEFLPIGITNQELEWTSSNTNAVIVFPNGKVQGKIINGSSIVTAKVKGTNVSASITVNVRITGDESVYTRSLPDFLRPFQSFTVDVPVRTMGSRSVTVELSKNSVVLGSGTKNFTCYGDTTIKVTYTLATVPVPGLDYSLTVKLIDGTTILDTESKIIEMKDHIRVTSVAINDGLPKVQVGKKITRTASVLPIDAFNSSVIWSSGNTGVATVNPTTGEITGVSAGVSIITAISNDNNAIKDQVEITVQQDIVSIDITGVSLPEKVTIFPGLSRVITPGFAPGYTTQTGLTWSSSNTSIANVDNNGKVTTTQLEGTAIITATSTSNTSIKATCTVTVTKALLIEAESFVRTGGASEGVVRSSVGFNNNTSGDWAEYDVEFPIEGNYTIIYKIGTPSTTGIGAKLYIDGELKSTTTFVSTGSWETYTEQSVANQIYVTQGAHTVRVESTGATEWQWNCDWIKLTNQNTTGPAAVTGVSLTSSTLTIGLNATSLLTATISPSNASNKSVTWSSSDISKVTVSSTGIVTGKALGSATITATTVDGGFTATCLVTVSDQVVSNLIKVVNENVTFDGRIIRNLDNKMLHIFTITGKLIATSNSDIDMSGKINGVYIVKSADAVMKIIK